MSIPQKTKFTFKSFIRPSSCLPYIFLDHGEDGFHITRCARRYLEVVVPCRFRILSTFLVNWRTDSVCKGLSHSFTILDNKFPFVVSSLSLRIVGVFWIFFFSIRRLSSLLFHRPAKVCILESHLRCRRCVEWAWFNTHPAVGFLRSYRHPWTFRCNRTRCGARTCRNKRQIHRCWTRLGHNSFFFFLIWNPLRHCGAACQAEILDATSGAEMTDIAQMKKIVPLVTCETPLSQHVCELTFEVNVTN